MPLFQAFGKNPGSERLQRIRASSRYQQHQFINLSETSMAMGSGAFFRTAWKFLRKPAYTKPAHPLPSVKTDLSTLPASGASVVWFGHSSYLLRIAGLTILVDPVFSGHASPFSYGVNSFPGTDVYTAADMPEIDWLVITHDHYDHLDHRTVVRLKPKIRNVCTSLGVGSHLEYWGFARSVITELDWGETCSLGNGLSLTAAPARHFSGRTFRRNQTLWSSFILSGPDQRIYIGADSGYDTHFKQIGDAYGSFDLALLETGQYNQDWPLIHMMPEQTVQAACDLRAKCLMPVHWGKFALAFHPWQEPVQRVLAKTAEMGMPVATPRIGEVFSLGAPLPATRWWE